MIQDVNFFIDRFSAIPEERWLVRLFDDGNNNGCANGLCAIEKMDISSFLQLFDDNKQLFSPLRGGAMFHSINVNNGDDPKYPQPTAKQRILAALHDIKTHVKELPKYTKPEVKEVIKYVAVSESIRETATETVLQSTTTN